MSHFSRLSRLSMLTACLLLVLFHMSTLSAQAGTTNWYHYEQGLRMIKAGNWAQASKEFKYYLGKEYHQDMIGVVHYGLGQMYEAQNQWERAILEYRQALRNDLHETFKVTGKAYVKLGALYSVTGKYQEGLDEFLRVLEKNDDAAAHYFAGLFYVKLKQYDKALEHADRAKELGLRSTRIYDEIKARK